MGKKGGGGDMAIYSIIAAQQQAAAMERVSAEALKFGREQFEWGKEESERQWSLLQPLVDSQLEALKKAGVRDDELHVMRKELEGEYLKQMQFAGKVQEEGYAQAQERYKREKEMYWPVEEQYVKEAQGYDTAQRREEEAGRAAADVTAAFEANRAAEARRLGSMNIDPSQGAQRGLALAGEIGQAGAQAAAETGARRRVEDVGRAMRADVVNLGRGLPSTVAGSYGMALQAGQQGIGAGQAMFGNAAGTAGSSLAQLGGYGGIAGQYGNYAGMASGLRTSGAGMYGTALQGYQGAGNLYMSGAREYNAMDQARQQQSSGFWSGLGSLAGMALGSAGGTGGWWKLTPWGADGGMEAQRGMVCGPGDGSGIDDKVPARLSQGEYVIPKDVVEAKGKEFFDKLLTKYHVPAAMQRAAGNVTLPRAAADGGEMEKEDRHERRENARYEAAEEVLEILPKRDRRRLIREAASSLGMRI